MVIIERPQGYDPLEGLTMEQAVERCQMGDEDFVRRNPSCAKWHRASYAVREITTETAPWGYVWYIVDEAGMLRVHSAQYDSSG